MVKGKRPPSERTPLGIVFTGGEGPGPENCRVLLEEARASGAAIRIAAADSGLLPAKAAGILPDWIIGDMDSLPDAAKHLAGLPPGTVIRHPPDKDYTDTELAVSLLREQGCRPIWIVGGGGGRIDHLFAIRSLFERPNPPERWLSASADIRCLDAEDAACSPALNFAAAGPVSVFPLGDGPWDAESSGLRWPLTGLHWERGFFGVSNEAPEGRFSITAKQGRFMAVLSFTRSDLSAQ
jgi:thiamine pyrophosphokinase